MTQVPAELRYTESHEWVRVETDNTMTIGITDHAQHLLGDLVYVELPALNKAVIKGLECAVVESVKAASDVYSPLTGEVLACNETLAGEPGVVNTDPYANGWLFKMKVTDAHQLNELLTADQYRELIANA